MGQSGTAVAGAFGAGRSRGATHPRACPDRGLARHARAASRTDQATGRALDPAHARQRICSAGKQGGLGAGASVDRTSRSDRRACRRPAALVLGPLRLLGCELHRVQRRRYARACSAVPDARREAGNNGSAHDRASPDGYFTNVYGRPRGRPSALRSSARPVRSYGASSTGGALRFRRPGGWLVLSVLGPVVSWLSRGRARGRRPCARRCARDRPSCHFDECAELCRIVPHPMRKLRDGKRFRR